jgi:hypothetical protein
MALGEVGTGVAVKAAYDHTMRLPPETPFGFDWQKGQNWVKTFDPHTALYREKDTWDGIEQNLNAGHPVLLSNLMGVETTAGPGHVILLLGVGQNEDVKKGLRELGSSSSGDYYIVADPAGHFFANPSQGGMNTGHYGTVDGLRQLAIGINYGGWFAIYPKEKLHDWASSDHLRTLTIDPVKSTAVTTVHSPVTVMITDPLGRKTGIQPDGAVLSEIPDSEYHVAVAEDETVHAEYLLPDEGKSVVFGSPVDGTYTAQLVGTGSGPFTFDIDILRPGEPQSHFSVSGTAAPGVTNTYTFTYPPATTATVVGRSVFYNNSSFDGADRRATAADDAALAADKRALLPGQAASFADVTSYVKGINGVMVDVQGLPAGAALSADDFTVRASAGRSVWSDGPRPSTVEVRRGAGPGGSDRVTLVWPDYNPLADPAAVAVANGWMEVTVKANGHTGLAFPDVFSFANLIGDTGDSDTTFRVNALDLSAVKRALNSGSGVTGRYDFNRDGRVNALDLAAVRGNLNHTLAPITAFPAAPVPASPFFSAPAANLSQAGSVRRVWEEGAGKVLG